MPIVTSKEPHFTRTCRDCGQVIGFRDDVRSESGKRIPFNTDGTRHNCQKEQYLNDERWVLSAIQYIQDINHKLDGCYLKIERVEKEERA